MVSSGLPLTTITWKEILKKVAGSRSLTAT